MYFCIVIKSISSFNFILCTLQRQIIIRKILTVFISCLTLILSLESVQPLLQNANDYYWLLFKKHHRLFMLLISIYILVWSKEHTHTHTLILRQFRVYLNINASLQSKIFWTKKLILLTFDNDVREKIHVWDQLILLQIFKLTG